MNSILSYSSRNSSVDTLQAFQNAIDKANKNERVSTSDLKVLLKSVKNSTENMSHSQLGKVNKNVAELCNILREQNSRVYSKKYEKISQALSIVSKKVYIKEQSSLEKFPKSSIEKHTQSKSVEPKPEEGRWLKKAHEKLHSKLSDHSFYNKLTQFKQETVREEAIRVEDKYLNTKKSRTAYDAAINILHIHDNSKTPDEKLHFQLQNNEVYNAMPTKDQKEIRDQAIQKSSRENQVENIGHGRGDYTTTPIARSPKDIALAMLNTK